MLHTAAHIMVHYSLPLCACSVLPLLGIRGVVHALHAMQSQMEGQ